MYVKWTKVEDRVQLCFYADDGNMSWVNMPAKDFLVMCKWLGQEGAKIGGMTGEGLKLGEVLDEAERILNLGKEKGDDTGRTDSGSQESPG